MKRIPYLFSFLILLSLIMISTAAAQAQTDDLPRVRAVFFWSATCPHCHYVIDEVLPPLQEQYGEQLEIVRIELSSEAAATRFYSAGAALGLAPEEMGVPMMIIGDHLLIGSQQIPDELPGIIDRYLAEGGVDIPAIAGLEDLAQPIVAAGPGEAAPLDAATSKEDTGVSAAVAIAEETGISGSIPAFLVLIALPLGLLFAGVALALARDGRLTPPTGSWVSWSIPILSLIGLGVAGYLSYVETQLVEAICGPIGDCNVVQSSSYAQLFGIPIGVIGLGGYLAILGAWVWGRNGNPTARLLLFGMAAVGVVFSTYLTYLELFVIEAVCLWCLSSAVIMLLILLATAAWLAEVWASPEPRIRGRAAQA